MRIEISYKSGLTDGRSVRLMRRLNSALDQRIIGCRIVDTTIVDGIPGFVPETAALLFCDPVSQEIRVDRSFAADDDGWHGAVEIAYKPGVTDPVALTAAEALCLEFGYERLPDAAVVQQARQYLLRFEDAPAGQDELAQTLVRAAGVLHNPLIQKALILTRVEFERTGFPKMYPTVAVADPEPVRTYDIASMDDESLERVSRERLLALTLEEMRCIRAYFADTANWKRRKAAGLGPEATDVELEMLGQTWSEHCKHKIFAANVSYDDGAGNPPVKIRGLFNQYIKKTTDDLAPKRGDLRSVFHDNSGVVDFDDETVVCFKAETHNSPSALDPYGGAITGIVGVNRDILGTGKGAWPFFNTNVLCFGPPDTPAASVPQGLLHPRVVMDGVHEGIIDGGNQSGIPVAGGAFLFDESYLGKPLVFCGTGGLMPRTVNGEESWIKHIDAGDVAVVVGGRVGKDGIHGATFSSLALTEASPTSAVQIGDPITQRKMIDFLIEARDAGLYKGITDNGAGGLSSSLGEMAEYSGGVTVYLDRAPLKYEGLSPWEIWVSESQERMSLALSPDTLDAFMDLARRRGVEATVIGQFTSSGCIELLYRGKTVCLLDLEFVHSGLPAMELSARWIPSENRRTAGNFVQLPVEPERLEELMLDLLAEPNIRSKESLVRQYDHEVQGMSVVKPFAGVLSDGPSDGAVLRPRADSFRGVSVTHGICPRVGDDDAYNMAQMAVDEAYRAHIALGGDPAKASALDNFCWPDPVRSPGTPDGEYKLAQLVRANKGLRDICLAYTLPLVSGKDSMKNDVSLGGVKVSVRPTLLVSLFGIVPDIRLCTSTDFKDPGDEIFVLGTPAAVFGKGAGRSANRPGPFALGGSYLEKVLAGPQSPAAVYGWPDRPHLGASPAVDLAAAPEFYAQVARAVAGGLFRSIHDASDGGVAVALAESCIAGRTGCSADIAGWIETVRARTGLAAEPAEILFNEEPTRFVVSVAAEHAGTVASMFERWGLVRLGRVEADPVITVDWRHGSIAVPIERAAACWQRSWED